MGPDPPSCSGSVAAAVARQPLVVAVGGSAGGSQVGRLQHSADAGTAGQLQGTLVGVVLLKVPSLRVQDEHLEGPAEKHFEGWVLTQNLEDREVQSSLGQPEELWTMGHFLVHHTEP